AAREGDFEPLIKLLRSGAEVTPDRRALIIKILEGNFTRPAHRQRSYKTLLRKHAISKRVHELQQDGWKDAAAVRQAQEEFSCSEKTIRNARKEDRLRREAMERVRGTLDRIRSLIYSDLSDKAAKGEWALKLTQCVINLLMAEHERAVGLTHEDPNLYPADIL